MATKEIKNVLVLGTEGVKTSQFCKLFEAYLFYDSLDEAIAWQPTLWKDNAIKRPTILVNNLKLICTPDLEGSFISKQIISVLSKFQEEQRLSAIIILLKQNPEENRHLMKLKSFLFNVLEEFSENILYVYELDYENWETDEALQLFLSNQDYLEAIKTQLNIFAAKNIFYLNKHTFYNVTKNNWLAGVNLYTSINNYIAGDGDKNGLETFHIKNELSNKLLSNIIDNLLELLIQIYIYNNIKHFIMVNDTYEQQSIYISEYKRDVTVCYGNTCIETITYYDHNLDANVDTKLPKICHTSCNCKKAIKDINCKIFKTRNRTCMQCKCTAGFHSQNYFKTSVEKYCNAEKESRNAIHVLAQFYLFKKQEQETIDFKDIFGKFLNLDQSNAKIIFNDFNNQLNRKIKKFENYFLRPINIIKELEDLYDMKETGKIIPNFVEEVFPKDIQLQIVKFKLETYMPNNKSNIETSEIDIAKIQIQSLTDEVAKLKNMMGNILNSNKDDVMNDNVNRVNSQLNQVETSVNGNKNSKEKDNALNLELNSSTNEIKNVLVLSTDSVNSGKFCKLFEAYLSYDSYENAVTWQPKLKEDNGINQPTIFVNNLKLICIPNLEGSFISKHIISVLSNLQEQQTLHAIIILSKQNPKDNVHLIKLESFLSNVLHKFPGNILYVYEDNIASYQCQETIMEQLNIFGVKGNIFQINENMFHNVSEDNWRGGVIFCSSINNYIDGDGDKNGLKSIHIKNNISKEILLHVINNLLELLILIYILNNTKYFIKVADNYKQRSLFIKKCKRNVTVCYGDRCATGITNYKQDFINKYWYKKRPNICHASCNCIDANKDVAKCITFETPEKTCIQCNCHSAFHTQNYFKVVYGHKYFNVEDECQIAMEALTKFCLFKKQNQETLDFKDIFDKFLYLTDENSKTIFDRFYSEFNKSVKLYEENSVEPLDILNTINKLYDMNKSVKIIPKFIEELFPTDTRLETFTPELETNLLNSETSIKTLCTTTDNDDAKVKIQLLLDQVTELKHLIDNKDEVTIENGNDLNPQLNQGKTSNSDYVNLRGDEKDIEEEEINRKIKRQKLN